MGSAFGIGMGLGSGMIGAFGGGRSSNGAALTTALMNQPPTGLWNMYQNNVDQQAQMYDQQAKIALDEAGYTAEQKARDAHKFRENQAVQYSSSGVLLEGTPVQVMNETVALAGQEIDAIMRRGAAQNELYRRQGNLVRNQGMANLLGSQLEFGTRQSQAIMQARMAGVNSSSPFGDMLMGLGSSLGGMQSRGSGGTNGGMGFIPSGFGSGGVASYGSTRGWGGADSLLWTGGGTASGKNTFGFTW